MSLGRAIEEERVDPDGDEKEPEGPEPQPGEDDEEVDHEGDEHDDPQVRHRGPGVVEILEDACADRPFPGPRGTG